MRRWTAMSMAVSLTILFTGGLAGGDQKAPHFRTGVEMVVVNVTVTDPLDRYVVGLQPEHFRIYEDKIEQQLLHFSNDQSAISAGLILDISGSMEDNILSARNSLVRFLEQGTPDDRYFLITFNQRAHLVQDIVQRRETVQNQVSFADTGGRTALYDAIYLGLEKMRDIDHDKKALIVVTDGEDNSSRYTFSEIKEFARESDVQIYVIGERGQLGYGRHVITDLVQLSGGRAFFPNDFKQLDYFCDLIHTELRHQYLLGYAPSNRDASGDWRDIKVKLEAPDGLPRLSIRSRDGYYAPRR